MEAIHTIESDEYFRSQWDPVTFNWQFAPSLLKHNVQHINIWWDPEKFSWEHTFWALCEYAHDYFDIWWNVDKYLEYITPEFDHFLAIHCSDHFETWYISNKFDVQTNYHMLNEYCPQWLHIWGPDYIMATLGPDQLWNLPC